MKRNIYVLTHQSYQGDRNQSIAVVDALKLDSKPIEYSENKFTENEIKGMTANDIVITAGVFGLKSIEKIKKMLPGYNRPLTVLTGHQYFSEFKTLELDHYPDIIGLPQGSLETGQLELLAKNAKFVPLVGVPHTVTEANVQKDFKEFKNSPDLAGKIPVGIILGGDAPDHKSKTTKFFTPDDARKRAKFILQDLENSGFLNEKMVLIITNGPRTGQHNYVTQAIRDPNPHKDKQIDEVSAAFLDEFKKQKVSDQQIQFYNFDYTVPSAYKPILYLIDLYKGLLYVPAESVSMVTESEYVSRRGGKVVVYAVSSQNSGHTENNQHWFNLGFIDLLNEEGVRQVTSVKPKFSAFTDAEVMAQAISARLTLSLADTVTSAATQGSHSSSIVPLAESSQARMIGHKIPSSSSTESQRAEHPQKDSTELNP